MRQAPELTQICCILIKNGLRKIQECNLMEKLIPQFKPRNSHDKAKANHI